MRVLLPTIRDPGQIGGTTTHISMLTRGLEEIGHEALALYLGAKVPKLLRDAGVVRPAGALNRIRGGWGMMYAAEARGRLLGLVTERETAKRGPWEVLNAQEVYSIPYLRPVADIFGIPLVLTLHGYPFFESVSEGYTAASRTGRNFLMRAEMRALRLADAVVTVDTRLFRHAVRLVPERSASIHTLMNFIDTSAFAPLDDKAEERALRARVRREWGIPEDTTVLFCPRRLVKKNGVVYPSLALATMTQEDRDRFLLLHAGEGGERAEIERIIEENGLQRSVRLLGGQGRDAVLDLYRLADVVLVPSVHSENVEEATSLSALEAMASGRPLIAGDVGGLAEMVVHGETGLLVPPDARALAAAVVRLADDPQLGAGMASAARAYVVERHSHLQAARAYAQIYEEAARARAGRLAAGGREKTPEAAAGSEAAWAGGAPEPRLPAPISVKGYPLHILTLQEAAGWVVRHAVAGRRGAPGRTLTAVSFNPELVMRADRDPAAAEALLEADLSYPDGIGAVWAARRQGAAGAVRVPGIDLAQRILELAEERGLSVYFLGAAEGVATEAARRQAERLPGLRVAGTRNGFFSAEKEDEVVGWVRRSRPDLLLVGMGAPRQEVFIHRHRHELGAGVALGVGGSFDVWAGTVRRAPEWVRRAGVEWLYRLVADPRRAGRQRVLPRYMAEVMAGCADDYGPPRRAAARRRGAPTTERAPKDAEGPS